MKRYELYILRGSSVGGSSYVEDLNSISSGYIYPSIPVVGRVFTCGSHLTSIVLGYNSSTGVIKTSGNIYRLVYIESKSSIDIVSNDIVKEVERNSVVKGERGERGIQGIQSLKGETGNDGEKGEPGETGFEPLFNLSLNFIEIDPFVYVAPVTFKVNSVDNPESLTFSLKLNGNSYTLGSTVTLYDDFSVEVTGVGFLNLNCEQL